MKKLLPPPQNPQGFTLVELLVVITILAILAVVGTTVFTGVQKNARDTGRKADIDAISKAFETNYNSGSPTPYGIPQASWFNAGAIPKDPQGTEYFWNGAQSVPAAAAVGFVVCAKLENNNGNSSTAGAAAFTFTNASGAAATHYCKKNQQ